MNQAELNQALVNTVTPADIEAVIRKLVKEAKDGKPWAVRELLDRCLGDDAELTGRTVGADEDAGLAACHAEVMAATGGTGASDYRQTSRYERTKLEQCVLGHLILFGLDNKLALNVTHFEIAAHKTIYLALVGLGRGGEPISFLRLRGALLKSGELTSVVGVAYLVALAEGVPRRFDVRAAIAAMRGHAPPKS